MIKNLFFIVLYININKKTTFWFFLIRCSYHQSAFIILKIMDRRLKNEYPFYFLRVHLPALYFFLSFFLFLLGVKKLAAGIPNIWFSHNLLVGPLFIRLFPFFGALLFYNISQFWALLNLGPVHDSSWEEEKGSFRLKSIYIF